MSMVINALASPTDIAFSEPVPVNIKVYRGDSGRLRIAVKDADGSPINVSAATWDADIRDTADAVTVVAQLTMTPVSGQTNAIDVVLSATESLKLIAAKYVYDVQMTLNTEVQTLIAGEITVTKDVSRTP